MSKNSVRQNINALKNWIPTIKLYKSEKKDTGIIKYVYKWK